MPKVGDMFGGSFLKAADLQGKMVRVIIEDVQMELLKGDHGEEEKWVIKFRDKDKRLVLNKTNANMIASIHGDDTDNWIGKDVKLYACKVNFAGQMVDAIRVFQEVPPEAEEGQDEVPF